MCCISDSEATKRVRQRKKTFVAYKIVYVAWGSRYPLQPGYTTSAGRFVVQSFCRDKRWRAGTHKAHKIVREYDPKNPHGFHFYFGKKMAKRSLVSAVDLILPVRIDPKDVIAVEPQNPNRQGVALKVVVTEQDWKELVCQL